MGPKNCLPDPAGRQVRLLPGRFCLLYLWVPHGICHRKSCLTCNVRTQNCLAVGPNCPLAGKFKTACQGGKTAGHAGWTLGRQIWLSIFVQHMESRGAKLPGMQVRLLASRFGLLYLRAAHGISHGRYVLHAVLELETACQGGQNCLTCRLVPGRQVWLAIFTPGAWHMSLSRKACLTLWFNIVPILLQSDPKYYNDI